MYVNMLKFIYTTNTLEGFNRQIRKFTKTRTVFSTEDSLRKSPYLATMEIIQKGTLPRQNWGLTLAQLTIQFNNKLNKILA